MHFQEKEIGSLDAMLLILAGIHQVHSGVLQWFRGHSCSEGIDLAIGMSSRRELPEVPMCRSPCFQA
jgi:hypothetical protein